MKSTKKEKKRNIFKVLQKTKMIFNVLIPEYIYNKPNLITVTDILFLTKMQKRGKSTQRDFPLKYLETQ